LALSRDNVMRVRQKWYVWSKDNLLWELKTLHQIRKHFKTQVQKRFLEFELTDPSLKKKVNKLKIQICNRPEKFISEWADQLEEEDDQRPLQDEHRQSSHEVPIRGGKIIDLDTCVVRLRTSEDFWTAELDVDYVPNSPLRQEMFLYLDSLCDGDPVLFEYLVRVLGTCLIREHCDTLFVFWGPTLNGKSLLMDVVHNILQVAGFSIERNSVVLFDKKVTKGEIREMLPKRLVYVDESNRGRELNAAKFKKITGGAAMNIVDRRRTEYNRGNTSTIFHGTLILMSNYLPLFDYKDEALCHRVTVIPFRRTFAKDNEF